MLEARRRQLLTKLAEVHFQEAATAFPDATLDDLAMTYGGTVFLGMCRGLGPGRAHERCTQLLELMRRSADGSLAVPGEDRALGTNG